MGGALSAEVFKPPFPPSYDDKKDGLFYVPSGEGERKIPGVCYEGGEGEPDSWTILYCKGTSEDIGLVDKYLRILAFTLKVNIFTFEYPGFGLNPGPPSEKHCYDDTLSFFKYLVEVRNVSLARLVVFGRAIGSSPALKVCQYVEKLRKRAHGKKTSRQRSGTKLQSWMEGGGGGGGGGGEEKEEDQAFGGLILQSPIVSVMSCVADKEHERHLAPGDMFENGKMASQVSCHVLIVHGSKDETVPLSQSEKLCKKFSPHTQ